MKSSLMQVDEYDAVDDDEFEVEEPEEKPRSWFAAVEGQAPPPKPPLLHSVWTFTGVLLGIATIGLLTKYTGIVFLVGAAGAMVVILFSVFPAPVAQPRNCILGNTIGGAVGVSVFKLFTEVLGVPATELAGPATAWTWAAGGIAVATTVFLQERTQSVHPPGGATALIFILGPPPIQALDWWYVLSPAFSMAVVLTIIAFFFNRAVGRVYPQYWF